MGILNSVDSPESAIKKLAKSSPGGDVDKPAERVLALLVRDADKFDPEENSSDIRHLLLLDKFEIYGRKIFTLYDSQCGGDISLLILLLRITELSIFPLTELRALASTQFQEPAFELDTWRGHIAQVKKYRPRYKSSYAVLGSKNYWAYLFFRALWLNDDYKAYCHAVRIDDSKKQKSLRKKYSRLNQIYLYWEDIFGHPEHRNEAVAFDLWARKNIYKLERISFDRVELVRGGERVVADERTVYLTIPKSANKEYVNKIVRKRGKMLSKALAEIDLASELGIGAADREVYKSLYVTERRLDVYYWRVVQRLPYKKLVEKLYHSDSGAWERFGITVDKTMVAAGVEIDKIQDIDLSIQTDQLKDALKAGKMQVKNILLKEFPSAT